MRLTTFLLITSLLQVSAASLAQKVSLSVKNAHLTEVFDKISSQTGYDFLFTTTTLKNAKPVTITVDDTNLEEVLKLIFKGQPFQYSIGEKSVIIKKKESSFPDRVEAASAATTVRGRVLDNSGAPLQNASIQVKGIPTAFKSDKDGEFIIRNVPENASLVITYIGYMPVTIKLQGKSISVEAGDALKNKGAAQEETEGNVQSTATMDAAGFLSVKLARLAVNMEAVIVTGIVNKKKDSFTGSASTFTQKELREVGGTNILQSLKTLDPAFAIRDNVQFGSDPNRLPDLEIRGKTSLLGSRNELGADPNQPLFILDGFESSLAAINDLDINLVESITILKDAASAAIYGSKAANGVVVVETVKPKAGKLQVRYTGNSNIQAPDLSSYNMMDAAEKLEFERLSGRYDPVLANSTSPTEADMIMAQLYNHRVRMIAEGVNTNWMAEPLRVGTDMKHSLSVMGGQDKFQFGLGGGYNGISGVMKGSDRTVINGNINLNYRVSKLQFSNLFSVSTARSENPTVEYAEFSRANPFYKKTNNGVIEPYLENTATTIVGNPMWNASRNNRNIGQSMSLTNFFTIEWSPSNSWRVRARGGLTWNNSEGEIFTSPEDTRQSGIEISRRGYFSSASNRRNTSQGDLTVTYAKLINKHQINLAAGGNINSNNTFFQGYTVQGFTTNTLGDFSYPNYSNGFTAGSLPTYSENIVRSLDAYFNGGYSFNNRYLMDLSLRSSGSSVFGLDRRFSHTWSVGLGWNLHNEQFISNMGWINILKIRGSVGNPGNQNFSSQTSITTYRIPSGIEDYFGLLARPFQLGNPELKWQITQDKNIGMDLTTFNKRFSLNVDYFHKLTDPLLITISMPPSAGTPSYSTNAGGQTTQGLNVQTSYQILRNTQRRLLWTIRVNGRTGKSRLHGIGNKLDRFIGSHAGGTIIRYADGSDPDDMWAIRSYGIDPSNGRELFLDKDGQFTYAFLRGNEVVVGNKRPDLEGVAGSSFTLGGFTLNLNFRYQFGAEVFNSALLYKVENVNMNLNQDRRALYDRWQQPGDIRPFKNIRDNRTESQVSSRFVQTQKSFIWESVYASYEFGGGWVKKAGLGNFRVFASARDLLQISATQVERGTSYPFARVIDTGLSFNF